ncbi:MAG: hypothetical protein H6Q56_1057 [Deltaproteobacteria bacterium]|nr:hypothetical protein [Deltaproteobacteria bacterium]
MCKRFTRQLLSAIIIGGFICITVSKSDAIPAFSREHNTECATCHTIFPALNEYGNVFMKNGFVWTKQKKDDASTKPAAKNAVKGEGDQEKQRNKEVSSGTASPKEEEPLLGAPRKSEPLWLAGLPQTVPLSLSAALNASYNDDASYDKLDLSTRAISLLAGGVFRAKLAFYLKYNLYAEGEFDPAVSNTPLNASPPNANDLQEFYLVWRNTFDTPVNIKAGRLQPALSLWKKSDKVGISDFVTTSFRVGASTFSADAAEDAIEANAVLFDRLFVAAGVVDRNGQDSNEGYGHISLKIGGADFKGKEPDIDLDKESIYDYMYLVLGGYVYYGRNSDSLASNERNYFYRTGAEMDLVIKNARLKVAYAREHDNNADFAVPHDEQSTDALAAQAEYMFTPDLIAYARYELLNPGDGGSVQRYIPGIAFAPIQNTKVTFEYQHVADNTDSSNGDSNLYLLGIRVAF